MKNILLICNEGMSTGYLCNKMNEIALAQGINARARAVPESALEGHYKDVDVVMIGPQIKYLLDSIRQRVGHSLPVDAINPIDFGRTNAKAVLEHALSLIVEQSTTTDVEDDA
ncbi:PTS sugar transporter subunit IIB [Pseudocitrobacter corydidari]